MSPPNVLEYNPYAFTLHEDPYEIYRRLRDEQPAYWNPDLQFWALSRFEDVHAGFRDSIPYSSANGIALEARRQKSALPMMITPTLKSNWIDCKIFIPCLVTRP